MPVDPDVRTLATGRSPRPRYRQSDGSIANHVMWVDAGKPTC